MQKPVILKRREIDEPAWNRCIETAPHSLTYAFTWYLDALCENRWDALVYGNYEAVMPLPSNQKYGIRYLYQPYFCQQLGLFGRQELLPLFLEEIRKKYRYADICLHTETTELPGIPGERKTYWLPLEKPYPELRKKYNSNGLKSLRQLENKYGQLKLEPWADFGRIIRAYQQHLKKKKAGSGIAGQTDRITSKHYLLFENALKAASNHNMTEAYFLVTEDGRELAAAIFLRSRNHYHYLAGVPLESRNGLHGLIDAFIALKSGTMAVLDFEGSEIPEIAFFFEKFGARSIQYFHWKWNNLPPVIRWLKP